MKKKLFFGSLILLSLLLQFCSNEKGFSQKKGVKPATGPLKIHPVNPRYFTDGTSMPDGSLRAVYLTGLHTWTNLVDMGAEDPPAPFDYDAHLAILKEHHHNFVRVWAWESTTWDTRSNGAIGKDFVHHVSPMPWLRTGPGIALDGKPKFDLTKFNPEYFDRLHRRVSEAGDRGIYMSVMLFEGWGLYHGNRRRAADVGWAWRTHPFNPENNINGIEVEGADSLSGRIHTLKNPMVNKLQADYIRRVVDAVNDLDNVLYEVINEGGEKEWNWWVIQTVNDYQRTKPQQHPVGNTGHGAERVPSMLASPADWISPGSNDGYGDDPPVWNEKKVSIHDTDHFWGGTAGDPAWVWRSFLKGHNPIFMDPYDGSVLGKDDERCRQVRKYMGYSLQFAERMDLGAMQPSVDLSSTGYCLANPGKEYIVYQPKSGDSFDVELVPGKYRFEWFDPSEGAAAGSGRLKVSDKKQNFTAPFNREAVLYLKRAGK
jgi:hypothetical protein